MLLTIVPLAVAQLVTMFAVMQTVESNVDTTARESLVAGGPLVMQAEQVGDQTRLSSLVKLMEASNHIEKVLSLGSH